MAPLHVAVALDGTGWHPASWREPDARPTELLSAAYWVGLAREAERGLLDFVTIEDSLTVRAAPGPDATGRTDLVRGHLDAVLIAARIAPLTRHLGLVTTVVATHTEPFHIAKAIATLDYVSAGRAGVRVRVSADPREAAHVGRRPIPARADELLDEAGDYIEVVRRLWDSWEDDAEIRDAATGRFVDRDKLHYINFTGPHFSVKGPSITPRPPQGQPLVTVLAHHSAPYRLAASSADVAFVTPHDRGQAASIVAEIHAIQPVHVFADLLVFLDERPGAAASRLARLDDLAGQPLRSDALIWTGTPAQLADLLADWHPAGLSGFRLRPGVLGHDLPAITGGLVPELRRRGLFRSGYEAATLRGLLGLPRPANRYATTSART